MTEKLFTGTLSLNTNFINFLQGRSGCAMVLGNFQCRGILLIWIIVGQGPVALACNRYRIDGLTLFLYVSSILPHLYTDYLILFCSSISCPLSFSDPFKVSHFLLFINLMSIISFQYIQIISLSFVHQSHVHYLFPLHSNYLIFFHSLISCPLSLVHHSI